MGFPLVCYLSCCLETIRWVHAYSVPSFLPGDEEEEEEGDEDEDAVREQQRAEKKRKRKDAYDSGDSFVDDSDLVAQIQEHEQLKAQTKHSGFYATVRELELAPQYEHLLVLALLWLPFTVFAAQICSCLVFLDRSASRR